MGEDESASESEEEWPELSSKNKVLYLVSGLLPPAFGLLPPASLEDGSGL